MDLFDKLIIYIKELFQEDFYIFIFLIIIIIILNLYINICDYDCDCCCELNEKKSFYKLCKFKHIGLNYLDLSNNNKDNKSTLINIEKGNIKFNNTPITYSNSNISKDFNNIILFGSKIINYNSKNISITQSFGIPCIIYRKNFEYEHIWNNNTDIDITIHPHGLCVDPFVDGSSCATEIGKNTNNGKSSIINFSIKNNSMVSAWHAHVHSESGQMLYGGLYMPYIIKDKYSDMIDKYFYINKNDIPIVFNTIELDKNGKMNSSLLQMYNCINFKNYDNVIKHFPDIPISDNKWCTSFGAWRGKYLNMNGRIVGKYTESKFCGKSPYENCFDNLLSNSDKWVEKNIKHKINENILKLRLVNGECSYRREYLGFIDENGNFLDFWVISCDNGFVKPFKTKIISNVSMERNEIIVDMAINKKITLIAFDFDITLIEKSLMITDPNNFHKFSIYSGCIINNILDHNKSIFEEPYKSQFIHYMNYFRDKKINYIPYIELINFNSLSNEPSIMNDIITIINQILNNPSEYYFNYPDTPKNIRRIELSSGMSFFADSWTGNINDNELPSLKFKFTNNIHNYDNIHNCNTLIITKNNEQPIYIIFDDYEDDKYILNINELKDIINNKFIEHNINLRYDWRKVEIDNKKMVFIDIINNSGDIYTIEGNNLIMQFMGVRFKYNSHRNPDNEKYKTTLYLDLYMESNNISIENIERDKHIHHGSHNMSKMDTELMKIVKMTLNPYSKHQNNPFTVMNCNIYNFTVQKNDTEKWIFYNSDTDFFDCHPFHFHLTSGFIDKEYTDVINLNPLNYGSKDVYCIKSMTQLAINVKFNNYSSKDGNIRHLGYMFHCHYMNHHDMNMMGQFYIEE